MHGRRQLLKLRRGPPCRRKGVKKSLKWTCKACGEKQSFLRAYGEGSAADCRCHVQKLNLLQGQSSEMSLSLSLRSLEEPGKADDKENAGPRQAEHASLQEKPPPVENRWLKYLERDAKEPGLEGVCFSRQSSSETGNPDPPFNKDLPRKRKWNQSIVQPPHSPDVQESSNSEVTWNPQKGQAVLAEGQKGSSCEDWDNRGQPPRPAQQVSATSKWRRFLLSPENCSCVHTDSPTLPQRALRLAEQATPGPHNLSEGHLRGSPSAFQLLQTTHTPMSVSPRACGKTPEQPQELPLVQLRDLFKTDEDFDDNL
ncbi:MRN complex-interacting protein isoform X2 [Talpa occidentalis]|uniref:MRN complex-interacting protein isoform X2 n=1 Tax=Talpa occidentalis TaxID=50954 RepID=UPI00188DD1BA|nr:MRN complex-interacting protein isoform X2 [Talpa occidentalis]